MNTVIKQSSDSVGDRQEGILGQKPKNVTSVAELMLFDSDINVYEEQNVHLSEAVEFNIRGKKTKYFTQKELDAMANNRQQILKKQELLRKEKAKLIFDEKPETMNP